MPISDTNGPVDVSTRRPVSHRRGLRRDEGACRTRPSHWRKAASINGEWDATSCDVPLNVFIAGNRPFSYIWKWAPPCPGFNILVGLFIAAMQLHSWCLEWNRCHPGQRLEKHFFCETSIFSAQRTSVAFTENTRGSVLVFPSLHWGTSWVSPGLHWRTILKLINVGKMKESEKKAKLCFITFPYMIQKASSRKKVEKTPNFFHFSVFFFNCNSNYTVNNMHNFSCPFFFLHNLSVGKCNFYKDSLKL